MRAGRALEACACAALVSLGAARGAAQSADATPAPAPVAIEAAPVQTVPVESQEEAAPQADSVQPEPAQAAPPEALAADHDAASATSMAPGPTITLPAGAEASAAPQVQPPGCASTSEPSTVVGGYGQLNLTSRKLGPDADFETRANLRRLVLFVSHAFTPEIDAYAELEWENAIACPSCQGSVEVEQAFVDWKLWGDALVLRAGLLLVPMGIINRWHEPPVFHGVERPTTDGRVIPTTWRELGLGMRGALAAPVHYELYLTTTLAPTGLGAEGLAGARTLGSLAPADAFAVTGRIEVEPLLGLTAGAAFFASDLGENGEFFTASGRQRDVSVPLFGYALDGRLRRYGVEARIVAVQFFVPNADALMETLRADGSPWFPNVGRTGPVAERIEGGYVEAAYDVLSPLDTNHQLLPFIRLETYDTQAVVPDGYDANPELDVDEATLGLSYRPIPQLVFKADVQLRDRRLGLDELQIDFGLGYVY